MRPFLVLFLALLTVLAPVRAQEAADDPAEAPREETRTSIFVLGDVLAGGLGAGMKRLTENSDRYVVQLRYQEESGLTRPDFYDWADAVTKIAASNRMDEAIVLIGSNDVRSIRLGDASYEFATPEWTLAYKAQIDRLIDSLKQTGAVIHWVSLPPMANASYSAAIATINDIQKAQVEAAGIHFIDLRPHLVNADGSYMERGPDDTGAIRKLRDRDGVRFMKVGNNKIGALALAAIADRARQPQPAEPKGEAGTQAAEPAAPTGPLFGQMGSAGEINIVHLGETPAPAADAKPAEADDNIASNTSAHRLFVKGEMPPPQPGRFDDFSYAEPAQP
jgi:hypothetical protein